MTRVVAVDASAGWSGVALVEAFGVPAGSTVVAEAGLLVRGSHAAHLLGMLDRLLAEASWPKSSVDVYAATRGPGSFTGLRVGLGTIRGLGLASGRPSLGIGTLEAMAEAFGPSDRDRVPMLDAGRGDVYGARYDPETSPPVELVAPWVGPCERALEGPREPVPFGTGAEIHLERLRSAGYRGRLGTTPRSVAAGAALIAATRLRTGAADGDGLAPVYLRPADAEINAERERR